MAEDSKELSSVAVRAAQHLSSVINKAFHLKTVIERKSYFSAQLLELAVKCYEKSKDTYPSENSLLLNENNRLQNLSQSANAASNPRFSPLQPQKFNEQFFDLIESPQFRVAVGVGFEQANRQAPLMFNQTMKEHSAFTSHRGVSKDSDASVKQDKNDVAAQDVEKNSTPKLK